MDTRHEPSEELATQIAAIRKFNRSYTAKLGLLRRRHLDGAFSLTEARVLYEIGARPGVTATALRQVLHLDRGYLSRILASLAHRDLILQMASQDDAREKQLRLAAAGEAAVLQLNRQSEEHLERMLVGLAPTDRDQLVACLRTVHSILNKTDLPPIRIERVIVLSDAAIAILEEYYDAVHVVQRDGPEAMRALIAEPDSGMWVAYLGHEIVGCVALRPLAAIDRAGECKRLYVMPSARGKGIAQKLMDALEEHARNHGMEWIYLDSYDDLKTAIALYQRRGYERCARYNDNPQATLFMRKKVGE